jgi:cytochrome P450
MQIDLLGTQSFAHGHPLAQYQWLRENKPVYWHEEPNGPGFWAVTRYADVWDVDRNFQAFSSEPTIMIQDPLAGSPATIGGYKMMLMMDPPQHTAYRRLIRDAFTLPSATEKTPWMNQLARQIVNEVIERGECDFVNEVAGEMPSFVIAGLMGLPLEDGRELYKLTEIIHSAPESLPEGAGTHAVMKMFEYGSKVIAEKRARPSDDLASKLLAAEVDGRRLEDMEFLLFFLLLVDAGGDTTRNLLSAGFLAMMEHRDQLEWLKADPASRLHAAREELLRYTTPVIYMRRTARKDTVVGSETIREGDKVVMYFGSANRDPAKFANADKLDLQRTPNEHIAFGTGAHACLGQHIARIEIDAIITEVLARMDKMELAGLPEWLPSNFISGPKKMPVTFKRGARV